MAENLKGMTSYRTRGEFPSVRGGLGSWGWLEATGGLGALLGGLGALGGGLEAGGLGGGAGAWGNGTNICLFACLLVCLFARLLLRCPLCSIGHRRLWGRYPKACIQFLV